MISDMKYKINNKFYIEKVQGWWYLFGGKEQRLINAPTEKFRITPPKNHTEALKIAKRMI